MDPQRIGPYRIDQHLGSGGMGTVSKAWDERLRRWVAVKSIHPSKEISRERRERLRREARAVASVSHPAVTQVYDIVSENGRDYIVMEFIEGRSLTHLMLDAPFAPTRAAKLAQQIAAGLAAAHAQGVVHRDLKAENILVTSSGQVKILDFGLAKQLDPNAGEDSLTQDGVVMGTSRAMSPEQAEGLKVDHRSDLFSLGSLLYEMLTGRHPFQASSPLETMRRVVRHRPEAVRRLAPEVPKSLELVVEQLLDKNPDRRPQRAEDIAQALDALTAKDDGTASVDHTTLGRMTSLGRRRRILKTSLRWLPVAFLLLAVVVGGVMLRGRRPAPPVVVAVTATDLEIGTPSTEAQLAAEAVRIAVINGLTALAGVAVVDPSEVDAIDGGPRQMALAVAADEVVSASLSGCEPLCRVALRRLDGANGRVLWVSQTFEVAPEELQLLSGSVTSRIERAFPGRSRREGVYVSVGAPEDFDTVLDITARWTVDYRHGIDYDQVLAELTEVRTRSPRLLEAVVLEAQIADYFFGMTARDDLLARSRSAMEEAIRLAPDDISTVSLAAQIALRRRDLEEARKHIRRLSEMTPEDSPPLAYAARLASAEGNLDGAVNLITEAVDLRPSAANIRRLGWYQWRSGRVDAARASFNRALELSPGDRWSMNRLAELELMHGDPSVAELLFRRLLADQEHPGNRQNLGWCRFFQGDISGALEEFTRIHEAAPNKMSSQMAIADAYNALGDDAEAQRWYRKALDSSKASELINAEKIDYLITFSQCLAHVGRHEEAVTAIQEALTLAPDDPETLYAASLVYCVVGEPVSARIHARKALAHNVSPAWFRLPWLEPLLEDPELARLISGGADG